MSENPNQNIPTTLEELDDSAFDPALYRDFGESEFDPDARINVDDYFGKDREDHLRLLEQKEADLRQLEQAKRQQELGDARTAMADVDTSGGYTDTLDQARDVVAQHVPPRQNPRNVMNSSDAPEPDGVNAQKVLEVHEEVKAQQAESAPAPDAPQAPESALAPAAEPDGESAPAPRVVEESEPKTTRIQVATPHRPQIGRPGSSTPSGRDVSPAGVTGFLPEFTQTTPLPAETRPAPKPAPETQPAQGEDLGTSPEASTPQPATSDEKQSPDLGPKNVVLPSDGYAPEKDDLWKNRTVTAPETPTEPERGLSIWDVWEDPEIEPEGSEPTPTPTVAAPNSGFTGVDTELGDFIDNGPSGESQKPAAAAPDETQLVDVRDLRGMSQTQEIKAFTLEDQSYRNNENGQITKEKTRTVELDNFTVESVAATRRGDKNLSIIDKETGATLPNQDTGFTSPDSLIAGVADGVGSRPKSEDVSQKAADVMREQWRNSLANRPIESMEDARERMEAVVAEVDRQTRGLSGKSTLAAGMPFELDGKMHLAFVNIGDSGILTYNKDTKELKQITDEQGVGQILGNWVGAERGKYSSRYQDEFGIKELPENTLVIYCTDGILGDSSEDRIADNGALEGLLAENEGVNVSTLASKIIRAATKDDDRTVVIQDIHLKTAEAEEEPSQSLDIAAEDEDEATGAPTGATASTTGTMPVPPAAPAATTPPAPSYGTPGPQGAVPSGATSPWFTPTNSFDPANAARVPQMNVAPTPSQPEQQRSQPAQGFNLFAQTTRTPMNEIGTTVTTSPTGEQIIVNPGDTQPPHTPVGSYAATARTSGLSPEATNSLIPEPQTRMQRIRNRWNARRAQIEADADAVQASAATVGRHRRTRPSFIDRSGAQLRAVGNFLTGEDIPADSPDRNRKITMRQTVGLLAGTLAVGAIGLGVQAGEKVSDALFEDNGKAPSVSAPERVTPAPTAETPSATPSPEEASQTSSASPSESVSPSPSTSSPEASPTPAETGRDNTDRPPQTPPERRQPPAQAPETAEPRNENGYTVTENADGTHTITLSHSGTTLWNGVEKGLAAEGLHPTDAVVYDLTGRALEMQGKSWDDAANFHQGSSVTVGTDANGRPVIKDLNIR